MNKKKYILIYIALILLCTGNVFATTYYMGSGETYTTLTTAFAAMSGGDTLIIRDGTYTGADNQMGTYQVYPPNGTAEAYTVVRAENEGQVTFDGEGARCMFFFNGAGTHQYLEFHGIKWVDSSEAGTNMYGMDHIKFFRCGFNTSAPGNTMNCLIGPNASYILLEECYAWGEGRYDFELFISDHIILRRCVGRLDYVDTTMPIANFQNYCSQYVEFQNCIAIDSSTHSYWDPGYYHTEGGFTMHDSYDGEDAEYVNYVGCIVLNHSGPGIVHQDDGVNDISFENCVVWDIGKDSSETYRDGMTGSAGTNVSVSHMTIGNLELDGVDDWQVDTYSVTNSIIYDCSEDGLNHITSSDYNCVYGNGDDYDDVSAGAHDYSAEGGNSTIDPIDGTPGNGTAALKYLVRIENGSDLDGAASDSGDIGATILKKIGVSGTLWGESGYATVQSDNLWPFPYEDQIRTDMRSYNPGGTDETKPDGKRGFCADGQTLTTYIWEYLGNEIPSEIYGTTLISSPKNFRGVLQ